MSDADDLYEKTDMKAGKKLPRDPSVAMTHLMDMTQRTNFPPFLVPCRSLWLPPGVRGKREVASAVLSDDSLKMGFVELKYHDGTTVSVEVKNLAAFESYMPGDITQKWVLCRKGEKDLRGRIHE